MSAPSTEKFRLYLVRHAQAAWASPGVSDFERPLDEIGRHEARDVAGQALLAGLVPAAIVSSPARRCVETLSAMLDVFRAVKPSTDIELYSDGPDAYLDQIHRHDHLDSLMIVGHNPMIEELASMLITEGPQPDELAYGYPTAGLLALDFDAADGSGVAGRVAGLIVPALN